MTKGGKLSEFEKGEITVLKTVGKSQREISKVLGHSNTVICNYLKSSNKYGTKINWQTRKIITTIQGLFAK